MTFLVAFEAVFGAWFGAVLAILILLAGILGMAAFVFAGLDRASREDEPKVKPVQPK